MSAVLTGTPDALPADLQQQRDDVERVRRLRNLARLHVDVACACTEGPEATKLHLDIADEALVLAQALNCEDL